MTEEMVKVFKRTSMQRLMFYFLLALFGLTVFPSLNKTLGYNSLDILASGVYLILLSNGLNLILARIYKVKVKPESSTITALILALISGPFKFFHNLDYLSFLATAAIASKYLLAFKKRHIFNPAAFAALAGALVFKQGASWWVGSRLLLPLIFLGGILVLVKIRRFELVLSFLVLYYASAFFDRGFNPLLLLSPSLWFFVFVMLVEPLTSPPTTKLQIFFGALTAVVFFALKKFVPGYPYSMEASLLVANIFSFSTYPQIRTVFVQRKG